MAVCAQKHRAEPRRTKGRPPPCFITLSHRFNLDDFRTKIAQILRAERASENLRKIKNLDTVERF
jgi:hypothetical protein